MLVIGLFARPASEVQPRVVPNQAEIAPNPSPESIHARELQITDDFWVVHNRAVAIADLKYPLPDVFSVSKEKYSAAVRRNSDFYDVTFAKLIKPLEKKYSLSQFQLEEIAGRIQDGHPWRGPGTNK